MYLKKVFFAWLSCILFITCQPNQLQSKASFTHPFLPKTHVVLTDQSKPQSSETLSFTFSLKDLEFSKGTDGYFFQMKQCGFVTEEGAPKLPRYDHIFSLALTQTVISVETISLVTKEMVLPNLHFQTIPPLQPFNGKINTSPEISPFMESFRINQYPKENFDIQTCFTGDKKFIRIKIHPVYLRSGKWYFTESIQIRINYTTGEKETLPDIRKKDSVIVTPDDFAEEANQLKKIQEKQGYTVTILKLSTVDSLSMANRPKSEEYRGFADFDLDKVESIKDYDDATARKIITWLQQKLRKDEADYLTILGDSKLVPPSYYIYIGDGTQVFENWIPTDQFYACPFNLAEDFTFYLKVGRIPVRTKEELQGYLTKMTGYIANLKADWFSKAAVMGGDPFDGEYMGELMVSSTINLDRLNGFTIDKYFRTEDKFSLSSFEDLLKKQDKGLIYEIGHGSGSELYLEPGMADTNFCYGLPKKEKLPIMLSIACMNGAWDTRQFPDTFRTPSSSQHPTSFSQAMIFSPGGSIAYVGGARNNYGYVDFETENGIVELAEDASYMGHVLSHFCLYLHENTGTLGDISKKTMESYIASEWGYDYVPGADTFFGYILMGDPTLVLPEIEQKKTFSSPELSTKEEWKINGDGLPLCPIDNGFKMSIKTDSPSVQYKIAERGTSLTALKDSGTLKNQSQKGIESTFHPTWKAQLTLRVETEDYKENRFMFWSKYYHDLVIQSRPSLSYLRSGEKQNLRFTLINDGIEDEKDVKATIVYQGETKTYQFPSFPAFSQNYLWLEVDYQAQEKTDIQVQADVLPGEQSAEDNRYQFALRSPKDSFYRVGYWSYSIFLENQREPYRLTEQLNQIMQKAGYPVEFFPLLVQQDNRDNTFMTDRFKPDCIILDSPDVFDYDFSLSFRNLSDYLTQGGKLISFASMGKNSYDFSIECMHPLLNIIKETPLIKKNLSEKKVRLQIDQTMQTYFSKSSFDLPVEYVLLPENQDSFATLFQDPAFIGTEEESGVVFVDTGNVSVLNATLNWSKIIDNPDVGVFVYDLIRYMVQKPVMPYLRGVSFTPPIGSKNQTAAGIAHIDYFGNTDSPPLEIIVKGETGWEQTIPVESLQPYQKKDIPFELNFHKLSGVKTVEVILQATVNGLSQEISRFSQPYTILTNDEPDEPPSLVIKGEKSLTTIDLQCTLEGSTHPDAEISINQQRVGVNEDGSFQVIQPLSPGNNQFEIVASQGSLSTKEIISVVRLQPIRISLPIGKKFCLVNGEEKKLDEPAIITNGSTFVPLRFLAESFMIQVDWNAKEQKITLVQNALKIELWVGKKTALINGKEYLLSNPPFIKNGRTLLPVRFIAEGMKAVVTWNKDNQEVFIQLGIPFSENTTLTNLFKTTLNQEEEEEPPIVLDEPLPAQYEFPLCMDQYEDKIYSISNQNILVYNQNFEVIQTSPIPESFWSGGEIKNKQEILSIANRVLLRVTEQYLILTDALTSVYIYNRETLELIDQIRNSEYGLCLSNESIFRNLFDIEVSQDGKLYLGSLYGIVVYDLNNHVVISNLDIFFAADIVLSSDRIYVSSLTDIDVYSLQGAHIKTIETEEYFMFFYSMTLYENETLLIFDPMDQALRLIKEDGSIVKKVSLTAKYGYLIEKIFRNGEKCLVLSIFTSKKIPYIQTKLIEMDSKFKITNETHKDFTKAIKSLGKYLPNPTDVYLAEDNTRYVKLINPLSSVSFVKIPPEADEFEEIPISFEYESASFLDRIIDQYYYPDQQLGFLIMNLITNQATVFIYDFKEEDSTSFVLKPKNEYSVITSFAFDHKKVIGYDQFFSEFVLFSAKSGEEIDRFSVLPDLKPFSVTELLLREDTVYYMDKFAHSISSLELKGKQNPIFEATNFLPDYGTGMSSYDVDEEGNVFILDHISGTITKTKGEETTQWGKSHRITEPEQTPSFFHQYYHPVSIAVNANRILVNDFGNQRLVEIPKNAQETLMEKPTTVNLFPDTIRQEFFREKEITIPISVQISHQKGNITLSDLPDYVKVTSFTPTKASQVIHLTIHPSAITKEITDTITVSCNQISHTIQLTLQPLSAYLKGSHDSPYVFFPNGYFLSKSPITIQKGIVVAGEDFLRFYGVDVYVTGKEIQISHTGITFLLNPQTNVGFLYPNKVKIPFELDLPLKKDEQQWLIPLNSILDMFSKPVTVNQNSVLFSY